MGIVLRRGRYCIHHEYRCCTANHRSRRHSPHRSCEYVEYDDCSTTKMCQGTTSTFYLAFANAVAYLSSDSITATSGRRSLFYHSAAQLLIRLSVVLWLIGCGITITFTVARHASCSSKIHGPANIDTGMPCVLQRSGVGASLLAL